MTTETTAMTVSERAALPQPVTVDDLVRRVEYIRDVQRRVMERGVHYGRVPGTDKDTLLKPGAETLLLAFRLDAQPVILSEQQLPEARHEYHAWDRPWDKQTRKRISMTATGYYGITVRVDIYHQDTGQRLGAGIGSCNSWESKYVSRPWPETQNTIVKMAEKRALVAAILHVTAASDVFTQDLEDMDTLETEPHMHSGPPVHSEPAARTQVPRIWTMADSFRAAIRDSESQVLSRFERAVAEKGLTIAQVLASYDVPDLEAIDATVGAVWDRVNALAVQARIHAAERKTTPEILHVQGVLT